MRSALPIGINPETDFPMQRLFGQLRVRDAHIANILFGQEYARLLMAG